MATHEHTINDALAAASRAGRKAWRDAGTISAENTGLFRKRGRPDILIQEAGVSPVVIETEVLPAVTVDPEATSRLGQHLRANGKQVFSSIAVRLPKRLRDVDGDDLHDKIHALTDLEMALYTGVDPENATRWPPKAWLTGGIVQLSTLAQAASVPPHIIENAANNLTNGMTEAAVSWGKCEQLIIRAP